MRTCQFMLFCAAIAFAAADSSAENPEKEDRGKLWAERMEQFEAEDREHPSQPGGIVFVGSSSIRLWDLEESFPDVEPTPLNRGFGGSQLVDSIERAETLILKHKPRLVVVYAGDNDVAAGKDADRVVADYQNLVETIHQALPETTIAFIAIKPSLKRWQLSPIMDEANQRIAEQCEENDLLKFIDIWQPMLGDDGKPRPELFVKDGLHLNEEGYELWAEVVSPVLAESEE